MIDLKFNHVSKRYRVRQEVAGEAARNPVLRKIQSLRHPAQDFWAVRDVDFVVERGEALGIIGHNGAGKSTILKLLANITTPTSGEITINGRLSALIEVGSGFHPELTGRENIYLNGSILGMRRREISDKLDSIVEFAGVRQFLDTPVKRFSSGMYVRLGFSIAAHLDPDILLLDEVLAVGDAAFQAKCLNRIKELKEAGTTIVFISHDLGAVERTCDRVLLMQRGKLVADGEPREVIHEYTNDADASTPAYNVTPLGRKDAEIVKLSFRDAEGREQEVFHTGEPFAARVEFAAHTLVADAVIEIVFFTADGTVHCQLTTELSGEPLALAPGDAGAVEFFSPELGLQPGIYYTDVGVKERGAPEAMHWQYKATMLRVDPGKVARGNFYMPHTWRVARGDGGASADARREESLTEIASSV
ncbi:MAG: ABC transporter ATP-binding protein [Pyrinomonadaceae bacterium]